MLVFSKKLRNSARGRDCTLRLPGICNFDAETTVLAHLPCGTKGVGTKSNDHIAVFACACCHAYLDGANRWEIHAKDYLRALAETQAIWIEKGLLKIEGREI